ncbi:hypothetical protein [Candidatus Sulfurimonas baltica]|uniref:Uncharacterized protein n=1 Tax=Candidatus Sulfurimonas baltica TaxID=2740404 RepID=A0A7S7LWQ9_9BACT|nr:hypothetical protein [Candidatus Sulfurimonas baltica]QOY52278.1 hypothetical protein HUE88_00840 [Candidatus Sulfurimonas baltica]
MNKIQQQCKQILTEEGIDIFSEIDFDVNGEVHTLSFNYIIETFMGASDESQLVFLTALQKALEAKEMGANKFFEGMGQLLLMTHLSEKM